MLESPQPPSMTISTEIAQIYKARYGRGPTKITVHMHDEAVVCLLRDVNTTAQAALVNAGRVAVAQALHGELQMSMAQEMRTVVENATGRRVTGYVPGFNAEISATTDVFFLEPATP
jgi:uncharacterized protein YbcI